MITSAPLSPSKRHWGNLGIDNESSHSPQDDITTHSENTNGSPSKRNKNEEESVDIDGKILFLQ